MCCTAKYIFKRLTGKFSVFTKQYHKWMWYETWCIMDPFFDVLNYHLQNKDNLGYLQIISEKMTTSQIESTSWQQLTYCFFTSTTFCWESRVQVRMDPSWLGNPWEESTEVQNGEYQWPTKWWLVTEKFYKKFKKKTFSLICICICICLIWML